jgi:hypothetical protein
VPFAWLDNTDSGHSDIHESVESRFQAKRMVSETDFDVQITEANRAQRQQLLSVIAHAQVSICGAIFWSRRYLSISLERILLSP